MVTATRASPSPAAQPGVTLPLPAVRPSVSVCVRRSHQPRRRMKGASSLSGQVLSGVKRRTKEKSRGGCGRSRRCCYRFAEAEGVEEAVSWGLRRPERCAPPLARRLRARTRRAGTAKLGWSPAPGCMLIRWRGGVPRFLRPTTGAGGWAAAAAGSQPLSPAPATTVQPLDLAPAQARAPRPRGGAGVPRSVLRACGFCSKELSHRTQGKALYSR